jgi:hypothetical protein
LLRRFRGPRIALTTRSAARRQGVATERQPTSAIGERRLGSRGRFVRAALLAVVVMAPRASEARTFVRRLETANPWWLLTPIAGQAAT